MKHLVFGIDIGGTNTVFGLFDKKGICYAQHKIKTTDSINVEQFVITLKTELNALLHKVDFPYYLHGIGIGAPNANFYKGTVEYAPNLPWKGIVPLAEMVSKAMECKTVLTNDANAAAIGELYFGNAGGMKNFVVITLGTGLGSGIVVDGKLLYGHTGFAGELGHVIVQPNGRSCGCGRKGCLETYASATGIKRTAQEFMGCSRLDSSLRDIPNRQLQAKHIFEAVQKGDKLAREIFDFTGMQLGMALANATAILSPEAVFLLGGLASAGDWIFKPTQHAMDDNMLNIFKNTVKILPSGLDDNMAAIIGAAALAWDEIK